jgi:hypothetical protein
VIFKESAVITPRITAALSRIDWHHQNIRLRKFLTGALVSTLVVVVGPAIDLATAPTAYANDGLNLYFKHNTSPNASSETQFTTGTCNTAIGNINYANDASFPAGCNRDYFIGYATGFFKSPITGSITFHLTSDDSSHLVININGANQKQLISDCCRTLSQTFTGFVANRFYPINAYFTEIGGLAQWQLSYSWVAQNGFAALASATIVPTTAFARTIPTPSISIPSTITSYDFGNTTYSYGVTATGGTAPYTYSLVAGTLPSILTLDTANGSINYNPNGTNNTGQIATGLQVRVTDLNGQTATSGPFQVTLAKGNQPTSVSVTSLSGTYPSATLTGSGGNGTGSYSFTRLTTGTAGCSISGSAITATSAGSCTFTATRASDTNYFERTTSALTFTFATRPGVNVKANPLSRSFRQTIAPTVALSNFGGSDSASVTSVTYTYAGINGTSYASSTTAPTAVGTYSITPSAATLSFSTGSAAGYQATTYQSDTLTITSTVPDSVTALSISTTSPTTATVSFTAPSNTGGVNISSYVVSNGTDTVTATGSNSPISLTGLSPGATYVFRVNAINSVGRSDTASATSIRMPLLVTASPSSTAGIFGVPISSIVPTVTGGTGITYSISPSLPAGLTLNSNGTITGTPTETSTAKTYTQTATVTGTSGTATFSLSVVNANSSVSVPTITPVSPSVGSAMTFTSTVTSNTQATLTGTISFRNGSNTLLCSTSTLSAGVGSCDYTPVSTDTFTVRAFYGGMTYVDTSTSVSSLSITPNKGNPTATLSRSVERLVIGETVTLQLSLVPGAITNATGSVAYTSNSNSITGCTAVNVSSNIASCVFTPTITGIHEILATYSGDGNYNGVVASAITVNVSSCTQSQSGLTLGTGAPADGYCAVRITAATSGSLGLPVGVLTMRSRVLVIGGGGSGGPRHGGGGGAGSLLYSEGYTISDTTTVTIGAGGASTNSTPTTALNNGKASVFGSISASGGGAGGGINSGNGFSGGSGGGGSSSNNGSSGVQTSFAGFTSYVNGGGIGTSGGTQSNFSGGGGGGSGSGGFNGSGSGTKPGRGGDGLALTMTLNGSSSCFAAGGGGGSYNANPGGLGGGCFIGSETITVGGVGNTYAQAGGAGAANTGSGGGGGGFELGQNYYTGAGGSGLVALRYISAATITLPADTTVPSLTNVAFAATVPLFTNIFTRTYQWQKLINSTWTNDTSTSGSTLILTFTARYGQGSTQRFRLLVTDSDGTLSTTTVSRTLVLTVTPLTQPTLYVGSSYGVAGTSLTMFTIGGAGSGAISYTAVSQGSAAGCSMSSTTISLATAGVCRVVATKAADLDYLTKFSETSTVTFVVFQVVVQEAPTNTTTGVQISGSTTPTKGSSACVTGCVPSIASVNVLSARATDTVVITGLSLSAVTKVYFRLDTTTATSDVEGTNVTIVSDTQISTQVPAGLVAGEFYTIRVAAPDKTSARFYDIEILP